jgi:protein-L-isoaspartate(D-aspartate) O-methyltransferase
VPISEIGTGSGYAAAVLSRLCREVVTIERFASLAAGASATLGELGYENVEVRVGDGSGGAPDRAPFEGISVTATVAEGPPAALLDQLSFGGSLVCPVERGGRELLMRFRDGEEEAIVPVRFVPLVTGEPPAREEEPPPSGEDAEHGDA